MLHRLLIEVVGVGMKKGDCVRYKGTTRVGRVTHVAAGLVDVDFPNGHWSVVPEDRLEPAPNQEDKPGDTAT